MYTEKDRDCNLRKRGFKFVNKSGKRANSAVAAAAKVENNEIERPDFPWPNELMALMN